MQFRPNFGPLMHLPYLLLDFSVLSDGPNRNLITKNKLSDFWASKIPFNTQERETDDDVTRWEFWVFLCEDVERGEKPQLNDAQLAPKLAKGNPK